MNFGRGSLRCASANDVNSPGRIRCDVPNMSSGFGRSDLAIKAAVRKDQKQKKQKRNTASTVAMPSRCRPTFRRYAQRPECCGLNVLPISAALAPAGSQLVGYNEHSVLSRSPSGSPRWKQRLTRYQADTRLRIEFRSYFLNVPTSSRKRYVGQIIEE